MGMLIKIHNPKGKVPRITEKQLPVNYATIARNCDFRRNRWQAMNNNSSVLSLGSGTAYQSIFKLGTKWICWATSVDVVKAPIATTDDRIIYTGSSDYPKQTISDWITSGNPPGTERRLGVPAPGDGETPLTVTVQGTGTGTVIATVAYIYVGVTAWGEISCISQATEPIDIEEGQYVRLSGFIKNSLATTGNDITHFMVYRTITSITGSRAYQLVKVRIDDTFADAVWQVPVDTFTYVYDVYHGGICSPSTLNHQLGDPVLSMSWQPPPTTLKGLCIYQNNILAGFDGRKVYLSELGYYYAFKDSNVIETDYDIIGLAPFNETLIVATKAYPYLISGSDPAAVSKKRIYHLQPCLSKASIVTTPAGVFYAGHDGLVWCDGYVAKTITKHLYTDSQWTALNPQNLIGFYWQGKYYGFFSGTKTGIIIAIEEDLPYVVDITLTNNAVSGFLSADDNALYLLTVTDGGAYAIEKWEGAATKATMTWKSGEIYTSPTNFGCAQIVGADFGAAGSISFKWYADGVLKNTTTVTDESSFRLPAGFLSGCHEVEVQTSVDFDWILIGHSPRELNVNG
jgi:hypothetical protein